MSLDYPFISDWQSLCQFEWKKNNNLLIVAFFLFVIVSTLVLACVAWWTEIRAAFDRYCACCRNCRNVFLPTQRRRTEEEKQAVVNLFRTYYPVYPSDPNVTFDYIDTPSSTPTPGLTSENSDNIADKRGYQQSSVADDVYTGCRIPAKAFFLSVDMVRQGRRDQATKGERKLLNSLCSSLSLLTPVSLAFSSLMIFSLISWFPFLSFRVTQK